MKREIAGLIAILYVSGCAPVSLVPAEGAAAIVQPVGGTAGNFWTDESTKRVDGANAELAAAQVRLTLTNLTETQLNAERTARERSVTARLLRRMAQTYRDPLLETTAEWVDGGGDPDFAFKYALIEVGKIKARVKVIPAQSIVSPEPDSTPKFKSIVRSPGLSGVQLRG